MNHKTKNEIEMDFTRAIDQAVELEHLADDLSRIASTGVESALLVLKNSWRGDAGESTELAGRRTTADIYRTADNLMRVAKSIRLTADLVYKAEIKAADLCF
ncbi:MAG: hypothetical protein K6F87_03510 [Lachnospiraceae bacterium]|nr:hypothetical protein [Lachnospiraceae bacterium]